MTSAPINPIYYDGTRYFNLSLIWSIQLDTVKFILKVNGVDLGYYSYANYENLMDKWCTFLGYEYVHGQQPLKWTNERRSELNHKNMRDRLLEDTYNQKFNN